MKAKLKNLLLRVVLIRLSAAAIVFSLTAIGGIPPLVTSAWSHEVEDSKAEDEYTHEKHGSLGNIGAKLANPLSDVWALQFDFQPLRFFDGDLNRGDEVVGAGVTFQPVLPIPLYGEGDDEWRIITRPVVPIQFSQPVPRGYNNFYNKGGVGDIQVPLVLSPPKKYAGNWILGAGPIFGFPTASDDALGQDQFSMGPAVVVGYKTKSWTAYIFPNYFWKVGSYQQRRNMPDISQGSLLYGITFNLPQAWQCGTSPTITYNDKASSGNKWNVPFHLFVGRTIKVGKTPLNLKFGIEHSVVSPDDFGKRTAFRIVITPVIPSLIKKPLFGK